MVPDPDGGRVGHRSCTVQHFYVEQVRALGRDSAIHTSSRLGSSRRDAVGDFATCFCEGRALDVRQWRRVVLTGCLRPCWCADASGCTGRI